MHSTTRRAGTAVALVALAGVVTVAVSSPAEARWQKPTRTTKVRAVSSTTPTPSPTLSPSPSPSPTAVQTFTPTPTLTATATASPSPSPSFTLDSSFDMPSKDNPDDYRQHVDFNVVCKVSSVAGDDPIVFPGWPGRAHSHVFAGNTGTNAYSTQSTLDATGSNCLLDRDRAAYWFPQLFTENGDPLVPFLVRAYYRAGTLNPVAHIPHGLKVIAGDAKATVPQDRHIAGWQCRTVSPDTQSVPKQSLIPDCPVTDILEGSVVFPNCWDGVNLDSADHKSHMSYGVGDSCDSAHPVRLPQLTVAFRYKPGTTNSRSYLSSETSGLTLHADFWNSWEQPTLDALVDRCINAGVHCGDVSPSHFPGPMP